ncbi:hypothetical protein [Paraburkholderia sp. BCC1885]|uniref:hypothetical protein n=1 Tax=Paraburkholderia sp. BCC1885 TaxID=2562669 RepID=UPI001182357A|nr:hypothetical protein [Paraburkholderia sp. BCC1885]
MKNRSYTRVSHLVVPAALTLLLAACGNGTPSESAAKQALEANLDGCQYITVSDFRKTNGIAGDDPNSYRVEASYAYKLDPHDGDLSDALRQFAENYDKLQNLNADIRKREAQFRSDAQAWADAHQNDPGYSANQYFDKLNELEAGDQDYQNEKKQATPLIVALNQSRAPDVFLNKVQHACPDVPNNVLADFFRRKGAVDQLADGMTQDYTGTIPMIRTDNGWQLAR